MSTPDRTVAMVEIIEIPARQIKVGDSLGEGKSVELVLYGPADEHTHVSVFFVDGGSERFANEDIVRVVRTGGDRDA